MKQGKQFLRVLAATFLMAVLAYLVISVASVVTDPLTTTLAISYEASEYVTVQGVIVRDEQRLYGSAPIIQSRLDDGEKAAAGQTLAMGYRNSSDAQSQAEQEQITRQLEQLEAVYATQLTQSETLRLEETIQEAVIGLNNAVGQGDLDTAAQQGWELQTAVLERSIGDLDRDALANQIQSLVNQQQTLRQTGSSGTALTSDRSGWYASGADGYETVLTPEAVLDLSPQELEKLTEQAESTDGAYGRLVLDETWYLVVVLDYDTARQAQNLGRVRVDFTGSSDLSAEMRVVQLGTPDEDDRCVTVFSCNSYLAQVISLREVEAELAFSTCSGLRVPKGAIRLIEIEETDTEETSDRLEVLDRTESGTQGEEESEKPAETVTQPQYRTGVYVVEGGRASFKEVEILMDTGSAYVVREDTSSTDNLWAGDEVIVSARDLFDGKVVR